MWQSSNLVISTLLLMKVTSLFETKAETTDDYCHTFPPAHWVLEGHYLETYKETNDGTLYYIIIHVRP